MNHSIFKATLVMAVLSILMTAASASAQTEAQKAFATIQRLPGTWEGKGPDGQPFQVTFKVTGGGSAILSEIQVPKEDMISMIHMDGPDRLLLTHYCAMGNQPRMQGRMSPDGKTIAFDFVDATNLASPEAGHMQKMVLTVLDDNHHTEEWVFVDHGKEHKELFDLRRKL
ncbi:MAG TPA: hypothetical protein VJQ54_03510 [Candidatus Sulfotelmatobacter sp.]|nr:hypothetical protein [Candidatus Sulfotelmatobacter sp.]